jgi:hypothetical protein
MQQIGSFELDSSFNLPMKQQPTEQAYQTVDVERRGYGRRYTGLPVDTLSREEFSIDFTGAYTRPEMIDIQVGDTIRWREGERFIQGQASEIQRNGEMLHVRLDQVVPLPPDSFYP